MYKNQNSNFNVLQQLFVFQVSSVSIVNQLARVMSMAEIVWKDTRLVYNNLQKDYEKNHITNISDVRIWLPDIQVRKCIYCYVGKIIEYMNFCCHNRVGCHFIIPSGLQKIFCFFFYSAHSLF